MICSMLPSTHFHSPLSFHLRKIDVHWYFRKCCCLVAKLCPTLCDPKDCSSPDYSVHGISQVRILKWVAISFSRASSQPKDWICISCIGRQILLHWATREAPWECYSAIKRNEGLTHSATSMSLESIMLSEGSQTWKATCYMILFIWNI